jgi:C4-dicarboxylate-specific signal transduction histidine kinase
LTRPTRERVVVVEDEPAILQILVTVLSDESFDVIACADAKEGAAALSEGADVLLTDKNLPDGSGLDLVRIARSQGAEAIVLTGYASLDTAREAMQLGDFDYLVKPPRDIFDVKRKVIQALERRRILRENRDLLDTLKVQNAVLERSLADLQQAQDELIQSEKLAGIGTLAAGIAHEIRSPLFGILGLSEAIADETDLDVARGYAREIIEYSRSIRDIVTDLTTYTRSSEREYLSSTTLQGAIEDAVRLLQRATTPPASVDVEMPPEPIPVRARPGELQQVFLNLLKNAIDSVRSHGGEITRIEARREGNTAIVEVRDDGPGIPIDIRKRIFDPFFTTKAPGEGTGLGLNIVYRLVTKYGGVIQVDDAPEGGARFVLKFPVALESS